ncbi:unnamed protein product [Soboliphyme baturini]|uniref:Uncharacterized protein n=1 Tax=Soboliphyme baturini TaxID=241478 RepID=A0A183IBP2_9BILA|nr:unnamed protein product [Soboliphyme baturini]
MCQSSRIWTYETQKYSRSNRSKEVKFKLMNASLRLMFRRCAWTLVKCS